MNLFRIAGIQLAVHVTFLALLAYIAWEGWLLAGWEGVGWSIVYLFAIFTCITLHELGHAMMARSYGVHVPRILLMPIGGLAEFDSIPRRPRSELAIALAGPAVNFGVVVLLLILVPWPSPWWVAGLPNNLVEFAQDMVRFNLFMGLFNLIPVFPMDGGRVLRASLAMRLRYLQATTIAATIGKILASVLALYMIWPPSHYLGAALFVFIFVAGELELRAVRRREKEEAEWRQLLVRLASQPPPLPRI